MKKFLIVNFPGHGHVNPTLKLVKELINFGNDVVYYCTEEFRDKIEQTGAIFKSYKFKAVEEEERGNQDSILENEVNLSDGILAKILNEKENFDVIIYDSVLSVGEDIAKKLNIKETVSLYTTFAISKNMISRRMKTSPQSSLIESSSIKFKKRTEEINKKYDIELK